ncbi:class I SAM-dependent methyltransferase [Streptococcus sp. FT1-106]|uniref:class I SAM-dependent methyltransferase n=1 Tax=Streptococcus sp. FT1-106 TaxID=3409994 RepID=UPI003BF4D425
MNGEELKIKWKQDENKSFEGWDFSYLADRWETEKLPWNYKKIVKNYLKPEHQLLDMGTGGGEFLLTLKHPYKNTAVTEMWEPNVKLCKETLSPLGINVKQVYRDDELPFEENTFDLVINQHESYDVNEVKRILKPNGLFITQQVGSKNNEKLSNFLIDDFKPDFTENNLDNRVQELQENSFEILSQEEYFPYLHFFDVGAIVYFAKVIEWEFPGFTVEKNFDKLYDLEQKLQEKNYIESLEHRFIILAKNRK